MVWWRVICSHDLAVDSALKVNREQNPSNKLAVKRKTDQTFFTCLLHLKFLFLLYRYQYRKEVHERFFCSEFELPRAQSCWLALYQWRAENRLSRDVFDVFVMHTCRPCWLMTSLLGTTWNGSTHDRVFGDLHTSVCNQEDEKWRVKLRCGYFFMFTNSSSSSSSSYCYYCVPVHTPIAPSLVGFPFKSNQSFPPWYTPPLVLLPVFVKQHCKSVTAMNLFSLVIAAAGFLPGSQSVNGDGVGCKGGH